MPSPTIPRSKSTPDISGEAPPSPSHSDVRTSWSENSPRTWPRKVLGAFMAAKTSGSSSATNDGPTLTEANLIEFNRLNAILEDRRDFQHSPYYKGLSRLNEETPSSPNPDGESHTGSLISSSTKTSLVFKMQGWGTSCFHYRDRDKGKSSQRDFLVVPSPQPLPSSLRAAPAKRERAAKPSTGEVRANRGKPLRERLSQPPSPPPTPPPTPPHPEQLPPQTQPRWTTIQAAAQPLVSTQARVQEMPTSSVPTQAQPSVSTQARVREMPTSKPPEEDSEHEKRFIWADKYRPYALQDFLCNRNKALELQAMAKSQGCGHFIFEGQPGVGKKTMIWAFLREAYGEDNVQAREESKKFILKGEAIGSINVKIQQSSKHVEINISELRGYEKHVIVELIKERSDRSIEDVSQCNPDNCRAIILYDADKLPTESLLYIRWILERYRACNKLFFCCSDASKIKPLSSLCTIVQLLPPSDEEIIKVLEFIAQKEGIKLPNKLAAKIAETSKHNLRQAIRSFEATWQFNSILTEDREIMSGWEDDIANIARNVIEEQSPKRLYIIRGKLQNLVEHNVSAEYIFETLVKELKKNMDEQLQKQVDILYGKYNNDSKKHYTPASRQEEMSKGLHDPVRKSVQHFLKIEEFVAKFMSWYKCMAIKNKEQELSHQEIIQNDYGQSLY